MTVETTYGEQGMQAAMPGFGAVMFTPSRRYIVLLLNTPVEFQPILVEHSYRFPWRWI
jgi:hypothetical protein